MQKLQGLGETEAPLLEGTHKITDTRIQHKQELHTVKMAILPKAMHRFNASPGFFTGLELFFFFNLYVKTKDPEEPKQS